MTDTEVVLSTIAFGTSAWAIGATVAAGLMMRGQTAMLRPLRKEIRALVERIDGTLPTRGMRHSSMSLVADAAMSDAARSAYSKLNSRRPTDQTVVETQHQGGSL